MVGVMDFGQAVKAGREARGWDQGDLARLHGSVTQQTVSRWERGASRPRREVVVQLAELLELEPLRLLAAAGRASASQCGLAPRCCRSPS
jgi:transcriptional regulator with XRE-family HTH domain